MVKKFSKIKAEHPRSFRVRNYSRLAEFLNSIFINNVNELIAGCDNLNEANDTFKREVLYYANKYIPIKTVIKKNSSKPFVKKNTKDLIKDKAEAYKVFKESGKVEDLEEYKKLTKIVKKGNQ